MLAKGPNRALRADTRRTFVIKACFEASGVLNTVRLPFALSICVRGDKLLAEHVHLITLATFAYLTWPTWLAAAQPGPCMRNLPCCLAGKLRQIRLRDHSRRARAY
eukprot:gb/GFBE01066730.1/.p1 GENE.gb/GFBE01066730.1/~~gb/GFBE01066730.1/.p1  ORF type:complete len:106 (+),score=9.79 gb/GFBE01066730.1/:1-318(+)